MKKKIFAVALAATMALSSVMTAFAAETLTGTEWWKGMKVGQDYAIKDGESVTLTVETKAEDAGGAFSVELYNAGTEAEKDGYFMTTGTDGNGWFAELAEKDAVITSPFKENNNANPGLYVPGNTYDVKVTRNGKNLKMEYFDVTANKLIYTIKGTVAVELPADMNVHVMAQVGTFTVTKKVEAATEAPAAGTTATTATTAGTGTPETSDVATTSIIILAAVAAIAVVVLKKKEVTE